MQWFKKKQTEAITAIRCSGNTTYIANVTQRPNAKPLVTLAAKEHLNLEKERDIKQLVKSYQLNTKPVSFLLEISDHEHIQIEKPNVDDSELNEAARWALQELVNRPVEALTVDVINIPVEGAQDTEQEYVYVFYAENERIEAISNNLIDANIQLKTIEARIMAQRNIANLLAKPDEGEAILSFSSAGALITFSYQGNICNARYIDIPLEQSDAYYEKISLEIQRSLDGFEARFKNIFIKALLVAPFDLQDEFCLHLSESVYTEVKPFNLNDLFDYGEGIKLNDLSSQASFMPVLGAALRNEAVA